MPSARSLVILTSVLVLSGCFGRSAPQPEPFTLDNAARNYVRLAVALGERDPDSLDYYSGPAELVADIRKTPPPILQITEDSAAQLKLLTNFRPDGPLESERKDFLVRQLHALQCRSSLLSGARTTFDEEIACSFGVKLPAEVNERHLASIRANLNALLPGRGPLAAKYSAFEARYAVPPAKLRTSMERAITLCKAQSAKHLMIPSDETIDLELTGNKPWAGFSRYQGGHHSKISINADFPVTVNGLLELACHETYPGHHLFNLMVDDSMVHRSHRPEFFVQPTYSPQSFLSEGIASLAAELAFRPEERLELEREVLCPSAALKCRGIERLIQVDKLMQQIAPSIPVLARSYMNGEMEFVRAGELLKEQVLMEHYFEVLKYLNEYRSYVVTYTVAPDLLRKQLQIEAAKPDLDRSWEIYQSWTRQLIQRLD